MAPHKLLKGLVDNRVGKDFRCIDKGIEFRRSERRKNHRWIDWERVLNDMVAAMKAIREEEQSRVVIR